MQGDFSHDTEVTTVAFGSCNKAELPQPLWDTILSIQPQLFVWLGDIIYADEKVRRGVWKWRGEGPRETVLYTRRPDRTQLNYFICFL